MINFKKTAVVLAILCSPFILVACKPNQTLQSTNTQSTENSSSQEQSSSNAVLGGTVNYTDNGFSPSEIKVKVGQRVDFKNSSSKAVQVNSDPHPTHTSFPILNINIISVSETKSVAFDKAGTYKYHNHLNASERGTIVVE